MKKFIILLGLMLFLIATITGCGGSKQATQPTAPKAEPVNLMIAFAASLQDAGQELQTIYTSKHPDIKITYSFAASGTLQKQIEEGAPVDLFVSAGKSQMDALVQKKLISDASLKNLLGNELVLIAPKASTISSFEALTDKSVAKISIGTPETVPAGKYAQETLTTMKLWDKVQSKLVMAKDVRQVLTYVETGNVDAGLVYRSDTVQSKESKIVAAAPADSSKPIVYPMAIIASSNHPQEAADFEAFLASDEAMQVFVKYGFKSLSK
ncbi:MAG: molybdate ABC transporter substrate-binding protein [Firmicutes bacterium HGW-Firmicutes-15]|nr:MAG: molybdate ABC transporter substrate-binding protein [Firmicutes bacterium HGW-Firmicutes-15]